MGEGPAADVATCAGCGTPADSRTPPLGWMCDIDRARGRRYTCPSCARALVRDVEGKLDLGAW